MRAKMEIETMVICLVYVERLKQVGISLNIKNWKKVIFISLILASKVWDDDSYENVHFAKAFTVYTLQEINNLERTFLSIIEFNVHVK